MTEQPARSSQLWCCNSKSLCEKLYDGSSNFEIALKELTITSNSTKLGRQILNSDSPTYGQFGTPDKIRQQTNK